MDQLQSISDLFQSRLFRIPDYQRGYAWQQEQLIDFWDDVMNLHENRKHYTGLLSLKSMPEAGKLGNDAWLLQMGYRAFHVVDGQQRLTTIVILLHGVINLVKGLEPNTRMGEDDIFIGFQSLREIRAKYISRRRPGEIITTYIFGYETDDPSTDYLQYRVFGAPHAGTIVETYYTRNLQRAKTFFTGQLIKLYDEAGMAGIESLFRKLTLHLMFNLHEIADEYDVFVAFETMNNRGKKLSNLELLKNRLIYLTTLFDDDRLDALNKDGLRREINNAWKEVYYQLGRNRQTALSDDEFLRAHWIVYFQYTRQRGDDYIKYLLGKFSPKSIFARRVSVLADEEAVEAVEGIPDDDDVVVVEGVSNEPAPDLLEPREILNYVNSLKETAQCWYYSFFPEASGELSVDEKTWLGRLNRIGIGYFRPMVSAVLAPSVAANVEARVALFAAIERFIFACFRLGSFQSNYRSSHFNRRARDIYAGAVSVLEVAGEIEQITSADADFAMKNFMARTDKRFASADGFYSWRDLRYLLYEYEHDLVTLHKPKRLDWDLFTRVENDKISIEHILPQTPTRWYWQNQFRQFTAEEIRVLSASIGNLLPLAQSVNSGLQNESFEEKKTSAGSRLRGYDNGTYSELEVAKETDWDARRILHRGLKMLRFVEKRWNVHFEDEEQMVRLLHLQFVNEQRVVPPELPRDPEPGEGNAREWGTRLAFWTHFVEYCSAQGRSADLATRPPQDRSYYSIRPGYGDYHVFLQILGRHTMRIGLYVYSLDIFKRLEGLKEQIEAQCGFEMDWYSTKANRIARRILFARGADVFSCEKRTENFDWLITHSDKLRAALMALDPEARQL